MRIITAGNKRFRRLVKISVDNIEKFGYDHVVYNLGGLGFGKKFHVDESDLLPIPDKKTSCMPAAFKVDLIAKELANTKDGEVLVWLDGDARIVKSIDELDWLAYDIALTIRRKREIGRYGSSPYFGKINAGVMFFRKNDKSTSFVEMWGHLIDDSDQRAINEFFGDCVSREAVGETIRCKGLETLLLPTGLYNNYYFDGLGQKVKHFKGNYKNKYLVDD